MSNNINSNPKQALILEATQALHTHVEVPDLINSLNRLFFHFIEEAQENTVSDMHRIGYHYSTMIAFLAVIDPDNPSSLMDYNQMFTDAFESYHLKLEAANSRTLNGNKSLKN